MSCDDWTDSVIDFAESEEAALARDKAYAQAKERGWLDMWSDWRAHRRDVAEGRV